MADKAVFIHDVITGDTAVVNGKPIYVGANTFSCHKDGPASLMKVQLSNDKANWVDADTTAAGDSIQQVNTRARWARGTLLADTIAGRLYQFGFTVYKETE